MYGQSHLKQILPRRDEQQHFRTTEFPSHYYSSSSVYSYSPTSSSDCPEHGRSHKRTKIVLTLAVTFATLGVLSIAGVAVYLGLLSKNIKSGAHEESYLYSTAVNSKESTFVDIEDLFQMPNGRSRSDFYADDPADLTNRLEESLNSNVPPQDPYLSSKHSTQVLVSQRNATFSKFPGLIQKPTAIPSPVVVSSEKVNDPGQVMTLPPPIDLHSPLIILGPKRNKSSQRQSGKTEPVAVTINFAQEDIETTTFPANKNTVRPTIIIGTVSGPEEAHSAFDPKNRVPLTSDRTVTLQGYLDRQEPPMIQSILKGIPTSSSSIESGQAHLRPSPGSIETDGFYPVNPTFKIPGQEPNPGNLQSNHRVQLTFDRISPDFYDKKPWTPLLIHPTQILDKRPRVEGTLPEVSTFQPLVEKASPLPPLVKEGASFQPMDQDYYGYAGISKEKPQIPPVLQQMTKNDSRKDVDKDSSIGHSHSVVDYPPLTSYDEGDIMPEVQTLPEREPIHYVHVATAADDLRHAMPAYTVTIPHIPNDSNVSMITTGDFLAMINKSHVNTSGADAEIGHDATGHYADADADSEEYEEEDDEGEEVNDLPGQTRVYTLDPGNTDMFPKPIEPAPKPPEFKIPSKTETENTTVAEIDTHTASEFEPNVTESEQIQNSTFPAEDSSIKSTTDYILTALGSLNLVKSSTQEPISDQPEPNRPIKSQSSETPLFPPTRSYVSVHLPLREKPAESESDETSTGETGEKIFLVTDDDKKLRLVNGEGQPLAPDLTSTSSLNKVLSMMMNFEDSTNQEQVMNLLKSNVQLVVSNHTSPSEVQNLAENSNPPTTKTREHKSFARDPKVDWRFRDPETEKIPVPLVPTNFEKPGFQNFEKSRSERDPDENKTWIPTKLQSLTLNKNNSPVYKFVLRKGQTVEDLLKEIFKNFTDKGIGNSSKEEQIPDFATVPQIVDPDPLPLGIHLATKFHVHVPTTTKQPTTTRTIATTSTTTTSSTTWSTTTTTQPPTTTIDSTFKTSTSVVINEEAQEHSNGTFKCTSTGVVLSAFARCNSIKECADNSDEQNCKCVDYLKSQLLHRKVCDGIVDCSDESDESYCDWCSPGQYICSGSRVCVPRDKICDSRRDCPRGDDEANCVKIGPSGQVDDLEDISPIYHKSGYLMVRKRGVWGKLCVETFSSVLSHWEIKDLARAVCKAKTFTDFESVEKIVDEGVNETYYELYNSVNDSDSSENIYSSDESTPRAAIGFKNSRCATRMVIKVTCSDLQCGTAPRAFTQAARIVGGSNALPGGWPWQAALYRDGEYQCGATLISGRWLLSAGHCFYHAQDDYWVARLGTLRRGATFLSPYEQVIKITHIFLHPQYKDIGFVNDVSLLRLEKEVNFTDFVRPVCLPERDTNIKDGRICTVVGWGQLFETGRVFPDTLQEVQLPLISTAECRKRTLFLPLYKLTDEMFCAGFDRGGRDACLGDSGGPLMCPESDGRWSLYGVTSNGYGCARANRPGVYTKTKSYLDWVYDKISQDSSYTSRDKTKKCPGHRCLLGECLEPRSVCNGIADCVDGSDEKNCNWS